DPLAQALAPRHHTSEETLGGGVVSHTGVIPAIFWPCEEKIYVTSNRRRGAGIPTNTAPNDLVRNRP
ncbi:MAG: hypothetical protein ACI9VR_004863, partial [Cognaticolwellia sp.]